MKAAIIAILLISTAITGCNNKTNEVEVKSVNLVSNDLDFMWHDPSHEDPISLTLDTALTYGQSASTMRLKQKETDGTAFSFTAVDGNSLENIVAKTSFNLSHDKTYLLFAYGKENNDTDQQATIGAVYLNKEDIKQDQYRFMVLHTYPAEMGKLDIYQNNSLIIKDLAYGQGSDFVNSAINEVAITITKAGSLTPLITINLDVQAAELATVFIIPKTVDDNTAHAITIRH